MARPTFNPEKRQKELAKKKKQDEKRQRQQARKNAGSVDSSAAQAPAVPEST